MTRSQARSRRPKLRQAPPAQHGSGLRSGWLRPSLRLRRQRQVDQRATRTSTPGSSRGGVRTARTGHAGLLAGVVPALTRPPAHGQASGSARRQQRDTGTAQGDVVLIGVNDLIVSSVLGRRRDGQHGLPARKQNVGADKSPNRHAGGSRGRDSELGYRTWSPQRVSQAIAALASATRWRRHHNQRHSPDRRVERRSLVGYVRDSRCWA